MTDDAPEAYTLDQLAKHPEKFVAFEDEMVLLDWKESARGGMVVTLLLPGDQEVHPFKRYVVRTEQRAGSRFWGRFIELGEDDRPINQEARERVTEIMARREGAGHRVSREAAMLCQNPMFHRYIRHLIFDLRREETIKTLQERLPISVGKIIRERGPRAFDDPSVAGEVAVYYIYAVLNIKTRAQLDTMPRKALGFSNLIVQPFHTWRENNRDVYAEGE